MTQSQLFPAAEADDSARIFEQRSESLAKELDATVTRIESQEVKVAAELAARAAPKLQAAKETQQAHPERGSARLLESVASLASSPNPPAQEQAARTPLADVACENGQQQAPPPAQPQSKQGHGILRVSTIAADGACARRSTVWVTAPTQLTERAGTQFTCFTSTKVQILTPNEHFKHNRRLNQRLSGTATRSEL